MQGLVNDLSYGVILVLSLLLTLALPYLQRWLRYVSPLLVFVMLSFTFIGVALHATFDYTTLSPLGGPPADPAQATPAETAQWIAAPLLEQVEIGPEFLRSLFSMRLSQMAVLLLAVVASLRILIWQAEQRRLTPLLYAAIGAGGLLGVWLLTDPAASVSRLGH